MSNDDPCGMGGSPNMTTDDARLDAGEKMQGRELKVDTGDMGTVTLGCSVRGLMVTASWLLDLPSPPPADVLATAGEPGPAGGAPGSSGTQRG